MIKSKLKDGKQQNATLLTQSNKRGQQRGAQMQDQSQDDP